MLHLQALTKLSLAGIDLSQNNPFRLSAHGHVGPLQLFMAERCASLRRDATMCPGKPVKRGSPESKGVAVGGKEERQMEGELARWGRKRKVG